MGGLLHPGHEDFALSVHNELTHLGLLIHEQKISSLVVVRQMIGKLRSLQEITHDADFLFLVGVDSECDDLPLGPERHYWAVDSLQERDEAARE